MTQQTVTDDDAQLANEGRITVCPFCGSESPEYSHDYSKDHSGRGGVDDGAAIYKCEPCHSYFPKAAAGGGSE